MNIKCLIWNFDERLIVGAYGIPAVGLAIINGYGKNAVASYDYLSIFFATFVPSAATVVLTNTPFVGRCMRRPLRS